MPGEGRRYLKMDEKVGFVIRRILEQGPLSTVELIEMFQKEKGLPKSTARSSVSQVLRTLLNTGFLDIVDYKARGVRVVDITPYGVEILAKYLVKRHRDKPLWKTELGRLLSEALARMNRYDILGLIYLYHEFSREAPSEDEEEEEIITEVTLYDFIDTYTLFEVSEKTRYGWNDLRETLEDWIVNIIIDDMLRERGGTFRLRNIINRIREQYRDSPLPYLKAEDMLRYLMQVLEAAKDDIRSEIDELRRADEKLDEILSELKSKS